ncbi:MAG: hypothetical protein WAU32_03560 [Thermoanaerobaculia bacterium]
MRKTRVLIHRALCVGLLAGLLPGIALRAQDCAPRLSTQDDAALRAVVLIAGAEDPEVAAAVRALGANTLVTQSFPDPAAAAAASGAGLRYMARVTTREVLRLASEPALLASVREIPNLFGLEYLDPSVLEGYVPASTQAWAYGTLKTLFPTALVVHATRLEPIAWDPAYLDSYFRPEFTDLVAPYFYPVGTNFLGAQRQEEPWEERLRSLLTPLVARVPEGKAVLPVLQAFERDGYPVDARLVARQWSVYRESFPENPNVAAFWWGGGSPEPLTGMSQRPQMLEGFRRLFGGTPARPSPCSVPERPR